MSGLSCLISLPSAQPHADTTHRSVIVWVRGVIKLLVLGASSWPFFIFTTRLLFGLKDKHSSYYLKWKLLEKLGWALLARPIYSGWYLLKKAAQQLWSLLLLRDLFCSSFWYLKKYRKERGGGEVLGLLFLLPTSFFSSKVKVLFLTR